MKKYFAVLFTFLFISNVFADDIAVIDLENIVKESVAFKRLNESIAGISHQS